MPSKIFNYIPYCFPSWYVSFFSWFFAGVVTLFLLALKAYGSSSITFRETIYAELKGVYPSIELYLSLDEINAKIRQSVPQIQIAVNSFRHYLPFFVRRRFESAAQNYYKIARQTNWQHDLPDFNMSVSHVENPKEIFKQQIDNLLKYAK